MSNSSFVVEIVQLAGTGSCSDESFNKELFAKAVELMASNEISNFEDVSPFLNEHRCDAAAVFGQAVTTETHDAFAAYLCYAI